MPKQKTAAIYNRWLYTLGGGEQAAFAFAECLRDAGYSTVLLTHRHVDLAVAEKNMHIDLHDITIRYLPNVADYQLSQYTEGYDIFINNSYLDYIPNRSKYGMLSVFFPSRIKISVYEYLKRAHIVPSLRRFFIYPAYFEGFQYDQYVHGRILKWLGDTSSIVFNTRIQSLQITLYAKYLSFSCIDSIAFMSGKQVIHPVSRTILRNTNAIKYNFQFSQPCEQSTLNIKLPDSEYAHDIALMSMSIQNYRYAFYNVFKRFFPNWEMRLHGGPSVTKFSDIDSYDKVLANSLFTQKWIKNYWGVSSDVLYPLVHVEDFFAAKQKKNIIVHVGRFFLGGHSKKQLEMVRVFKRLVNQGVKNWEFHLIGNVAEGDLHQRYVNTVKEEAQNNPIFIHTNASFDLLRSTLAHAKIYWHATGLDENDRRYPECLEHFGITTVEAMAAGCVPVVINKGGQPEIITKDAGFVWNTRDELLEKTQWLITHPQELERMSKEALKQSKFFSKSRFEKEFRLCLSAAERKERTK